MIKYLDEDYIIAESKNNNKPIQDDIELVHVSKDVTCSKEQEKVLEDLAILNGYIRGKSFNFSPWRQFVKYINDKVKQDFVSYKNALLACKKTHSSSVPPTLLYNTEGGIIGVDSEYWTFVFGLTDTGGELLTKEDIIKILEYTPTDDEYAVKHIPQVLDSLEKHTARSNIGIVFDKDTDTLTLDGVPYHLTKITNVGQFFVYFGSGATAPETIDLTNQKQAPTTVEVKTTFSDKHKCHWAAVLTKSGLTVTAVDNDGDSIDLECKTIGDYSVYYFISPMNIDNTTKFTVM